MLKLLVVQGPDQGRQFEIKAEHCILGRESAHAPLDDHTVSRRHARVFRREGRWYVEDMTSANGTLINGVRLRGVQLLKSGDQIRMGKSLLVARETGSVSESLDASEYIKFDHAVEMSDQQIIARSGNPNASGSLSSQLAATPSRQAIPRTGAPRTSGYSLEKSVLLPSVHDTATDAAGNLQLLYRFNSAINSTFSLPQLLEQWLTMLFEVLPIVRGCVLLYEPPTSEELTPVAWRGQVDRHGQIHVPASIVQRVISTRQGLLVKNMETDYRPESGESIDALATIGIRTAICVPISARETVLGVLYLDSVTPGGLRETALELVSATADLTGLAIENSRLFDLSLKAERVNATGETVATLSHYIKNILQGLRGGADIVNIGLERGNLDMIRQGWQIVGKNTDKIYDLVLNMLAFSKDREPRLVMANINSIVMEVLELARPRCKDRHIMIVDQLDEALPAIPCDPTGIHHAVLNIVSNAIEAVRPNAGWITVATSYDQQQQAVRISISDNGPGIAARDQEEIFAPLHSTKGQAGTGLGLAVSRKLVHEHGGHIHLRSVVGEGSEFTIVLPSAAADAQPDDTNGPM